MSLIDIQSLTFCYDGSYDNIFENVSLQLDTSWKLGFTGRNGRGKTTFLQLLLGKHEYRGTISSSVIFDYFPFEVTDKTKNAIDVIENIHADTELWKIQKELSLLEVSEDVLYRPFGTLSGGEQTKVLLAALFSRDNHFLLIDEPTNHLDMNARKTVSNYLNGKSGFILVSHDRAFLDNCVDHILSINKTNIEVQKGNFSSWWNNKELQDSFEAAEDERLKKDVKRLSEAAKRTSAWSDTVEKTKYGSLNSGLKVDRGFIGHKSAKMMKRSKAVQTRQEKAIEEKSKLLKNIETAGSLSIKPLEYHSNIMIEISGLSISYDGKTVCEDIGFTLERGDRLAFTGKNGCGKSSILKLLSGFDVPHKGDVRIGSNLVVSYVPQDASFLSGSLKDFAADNNIDESLFKTILRKLDFSRTQFEKDMHDFSEGQKKKVLIAGSLCRQAHLYVWDEPLNFIDVLSRMQIEDLISAFKPSMLFVEHDSTFVDSIATKRLNM